MNRNPKNPSAYLSKDTERLIDAVTYLPAAHYFARLLSPPEVAEATVQQPEEVRSKTMGHWLLLGEVDTGMFGLLQTTPVRKVAFRLTGFTSTDGHAYCVISHQVERCQHRFLLSLNDPVVHKFLNGVVSDGKLTFLLGNDCDDDAVLLENPVNPSSYLPLLAMAPPADFETQKAALHELPDVQRLIGLPLQIPSSIANTPVREVCVSLLLPSFIQDQLKKANKRVDAQ